MDDMSTNGMRIMGRKSDQRERFGVLLARAGRRWRRAIDSQLQPYGLTEATWLPLLHLARSPAALRQKDLAAALSLDSSSIVRILDTLQAAGLIERHEGSGDRRAKSIHLTADGRAIVARVDSVCSAVRQNALAGIPDEAVEFATDILGRVCRSLAQEAEEDL